MLNLIFILTGGMLIHSGVTGILKDRKAVPAQKSSPPPVADAKPPIPPEDTQ